MLTEPQNSQPDPAAAAAAAQAAQAAASQSNPKEVSDAGRGQQDTGQNGGAASRPAWMPEAFWDATTGSPKEKEFSEHLTGLEKLKADDEARRAGVPAKPEDYKIDLGDVKLPQGVEIDQKNESFLEIRKLAHEAGLPDKVFNQIIQAYAKDVLAQGAKGQAQFTAAIEARNTALGENGAKRAADLEKWVDTAYPDKTQSAQIKGSIAISPVIFKAMEELQAYRTNQGVHGMTQGGRIEPGPNDWKPDNWDKLSSVDRLVLTREHNRKSAA